jgi:hypothetical protein
LFSSGNHGSFDENDAALIAKACKGANQSNYEDTNNLGAIASFFQSLQVNCLGKSL